MAGSKEATPTKIFPGHPVCMLCSESKDSHANLLHPQFLGVFWVMWPADAKAFTRPSHFLREKGLGTRLLLICFCFHDTRQGSIFPRTSSISSTSSWGRGWQKLARRILLLMAVKIRGGARWLRICCLPSNRTLLFTFNWAPTSVWAWSEKGHPGPLVKDRAFSEALKNYFPPFPGV